MPRNALLQTGICTVRYLKYGRGPLVNAAALLTHAAIPRHRESTGAERLTPGHSACAMRRVLRKVWQGAIDEHRHVGLARHLVLSSIFRHPVNLALATNWAAGLVGKSATPNNDVSSQTRVTNGFSRKADARIAAIADSILVDLRVFVARVASAQREGIHASLGQDFLLEGRDKRRRAE
jgi:hypothetical protein